MLQIPDFSNKPLEVLTIPDFLSSSDISNILEGIKNIEYQKANIETNNHRSSNIKLIPNTDEWDWLRNKIFSQTQIINSENYRFEIFPYQLGSLQYTEYNSSQNDHYNWHLDIGPHTYSHRKISIVIQLSSPEEYEGGILEFNIGNIYNFPKGKGLASFFPSYILHRVTPVTKGIRKSLVIWFEGPHFK